MKLDRSVNRLGNSNLMSVLIICCGICIDEWMLGIGKVWYFSSKTAIFSLNDGFTMPCDERHYLLWWYYNGSMDVRNW